ncbi:MAG: endospore germination permease [Clostridiales bacterium]|nr:endospore germination permease [Clostridiales bacterium]
MIKEGKIGVQEATWLISITIGAKVFYTSPGIVAGIVGNTSWYMTLISMGTAILGFTFICLLLKRFPGKDIVAIFNDTLGRMAGFVFSATLGLYLLFLATSTISEFTEVIKIYAFPLSPPVVMIGMLVAGVLTLSLLGLESLARFSKLSIYAMLLGFVTILILGSQNYDTNRLFPIFGYGAEKVLLNGIIRSSAYGEVIMLAVFTGSLQGLHHIKKAGYTGLLLSGMLISLSLLAFALSFPYYTAQEITAPMYQMASLIDYGRFIQRVEPIFLFIWFISSFIAITAVFYCFVSIYCKMFRIQDAKPIIIGSTIILFAGAMIQSNMGVIAAQMIQKTRQYGWIPPFILPLIALLTAILRKKGAASHG